MKAVACGSLALLIASTAACSSSDSLIAKAQKRAGQTIAALEQMTDADSLAAAGLMSSDNHSHQSLPLLTRAVAAAPQRPDLVWLQSLRCAHVPSCDALPIEHRLRELDPTNGAGWWQAIARAGAAHDTEQLDAALTSMSHTERFDIYWTTLIAHLTRAVADTKTMPVGEAEVTIIGLLAAQSIPAYQYLSQSCKGERVQQPGATEECRRISTAMRRGDSYLTEMVGVAIAKRVWPEDSPEWNAAAEQRRVYEYRSKLFLELSDRLIKHPDEYLTLCEQNHRESDLFAAQLIAAGHDPNPPATAPTTSKIPASN